MSKLERLLNLTALLLDTDRPLRIEEIGRLMEGYPEDPASFRRTFERDKDDLREMGIPVEVVSVDAADLSEFGYRIPADQYYLPDLGLEPDELAALRLAVTAVQLDGLGGRDALRKLGDASEAGSSSSAALAANPSALGLLHTALNERRLVEFTYRGEHRTVEPQRLEFQRGRWYLAGFDRVRNDRRSFRVDRIEGGVTSSEPDAFEPRHDQAAVTGLRFDPWRHGDDPPVTATVRIDASQAAFSRAQVSEDAEWHDLDDGSCTVTFEVTDRRSFRSFVLSFLDHAEVVSPPELRAEFVEWLEALA